MEAWLAGGLLPLLLLAWLPAGSSCTTGEVKWFNITQNNGEQQNKGGVEMRMSSDQLIFTNVNEAHAGTYTGRMENRRNRPRNRRSKLDKNKRASQPEGSAIFVECKCQIRSENLTVCVKWYKPADLEVWDQTDITALGQNCTNHTNSHVHAANTRVCECRVFSPRRNVTDTGNGTRGTVPSCGPATPQTNVTKIETCTGLNFLLCIIFGLAVGTLIYMPIISVLLWQCRGDTRGKLTSGQAAEGNRLSTAASVTGTEDLTYANLQFEKKGTKPANSDVVYTEIKPSQQKQSSEDVCAVSPEGEEK